MNKKLIFVVLTVFILGVMVCLMISCNDNGSEDLSDIDLVWCYTIHEEPNLQFDRILILDECTDDEYVQYLVYDGDQVVSNGLTLRTYMIRVISD